MNLENLISDDYKTIYLSHISEILKKCEKIFDTYPSIDDIALGGAVKVDGNSFNVNNSVHIKTLSEDYSTRTENKYKFYALLDDKNNNTVKIKSLIEENADLFKAFALVSQNPYYKSLTPTTARDERQTLSKKNWAETITKVFGLEAKDYYLSLSEKNQLEKILPAIEHTPAKSSYKL